MVLSLHARAQVRLAWRRLLATVAAESSTQPALFPMLPSATRENKLNELSTLAVLQKWARKPPKDATALRLQLFEDEVLPNEPVLCALEASRSTELLADYELDESKNGLLMQFEKLSTDLLLLLESGCRDIDEEALNKRMRDLGLNFDDDVAKKANEIAVDELRARSALIADRQDFSDKHIKQALQQLECDSSEHLQLRHRIRARLSRVRGAVEMVRLTIKFREYQEAQKNGVEALPLYGSDLQTRRKTHSVPLELVENKLFGAPLLKRLGLKESLRKLLGLPESSRGQSNVKDFSLEPVTPKRLNGAFRYDPTVNSRRTPMYAAMGALGVLLVGSIGFNIDPMYLVPMYLPIAAYPSVVRPFINASGAAKKSLERLQQELHFALDTRTLVASGVAAKEDEMLVPVLVDAAFTRGDDRLRQDFAVTCAVLSCPVELRPLFLKQSQIGEGLDDLSMLASLGAPEDIADRALDMERLLDVYAEQSHLFQHRAAIRLQGTVRTPVATEIKEAWLISKSDSASDDDEEEHVAVSDLTHLLPQAGVLSDLFSIATHWKDWKGKDGLLAALHHDLHSRAVGAHMRFGGNEGVYLSRKERQLAKRHGVDESEVQRIKERRTRAMQAVGDRAYEFDLAKFVDGKPEDDDDDSDDKSDDDSDKKPQ
ncbi:MAG: hypothetical protein MHM6MM_001243 [Cercozoa sp. M6MM]